MTHFLGPCLVSWVTKKQHSVAMSTAEAQYVAAASCCAQLLWIRQQLKDFCVDTGCIPHYPGVGDCKHLGLPCLL